MAATLQTYLDQLPNELILQIIEEVIVGQDGCCVHVEETLEDVYAPRLPEYKLYENWHKSLKGLHAAWPGSRYDHLTQPYLQHYTQLTYNGAAPSLKHIISRTLKNPITATWVRFLQLDTYPGGWLADDWDKHHAEYFDGPDSVMLFGSKEEEIAFFWEAGRTLGLDYTTFPETEPVAGSWNAYNRIKFLVRLLPNVETLEILPCEYRGAWPFSDLTGWSLKDITILKTDVLLWYKQALENKTGIRGHCQFEDLGSWPRALLEALPMTPPLLQNLTHFRASNWDTRVGREGLSGVGGLNWRFLLPAFFLPKMRSIWGHMITTHKRYDIPHVATMSRQFPEDNVELFYGTSPVTSIELSASGCGPIAHLILLPKTLKVFKYHYRVCNNSHERFSMREIATALLQRPKNHLEVLHLRGILDNYASRLEDDDVRDGDHDIRNPRWFATPEGQTGVRRLAYLHKFPVLRELSVDYWMIMGEAHVRNPAVSLVSKLPPALEILQLDTLRLIECIDCGHAMSGQYGLCREKVRNLVEVLEKKKELVPRLALLEVCCVNPIGDMDNLPEGYLAELKGILEPLAVKAEVELRFSKHRGLTHWEFSFSF